MDTSKQIFKLVQNDVFDVNMKDIQAVLKYPKVEGVGRCTYFHTYWMSEKPNIVASKYLNKMC